MLKFADKLTRDFSFLCLGYAFLSIPVYFAAASRLHLALVWNLFLAWLPLFFALLLQKSVLGKRKIAVFAMSLLWLLFFPNAPYMVTDLIHINSMRLQPAPDLVFWIRVLHVALGVLLSSLTGIYSLYKVHRLLAQKIGRPAAYGVLPVICLLGGYAVYIGRFLRFNSWDILRPASLAARLLEDLDLFTLQFSLLMGGYILLAYCCFGVIFSACQD